MRGHLEGALEHLEVCEIDKLVITVDLDNEAMENPGAGGGCYEVPGADGGQ